MDVIARLANLQELYRKKNHDYGNIWQTRLGGPISRYIARLGLAIPHKTAVAISILERIHEKLARIETLLYTDAKVADEGLEDTCNDVAILAMMIAEITGGQDDE